MNGLQHTYTFHIESGANSCQTTMFDCELDRALGRDSIQSNPIDRIAYCMRLNKSMAICGKLISVKHEF